MSVALYPKVEELYSEWLSQNSFSEREGQHQMMSFIQEVITSNQTNIGVVEAATGIGKTIAYASTVIPLAEALNKKVVIVTATVTLQEQIFTQDLPGLRVTGISHFSYLLVKGRRRYLCPYRLDNQLDSSGQTSILAKVDGDGPLLKKYQLLSDAFESNNWNGDTDNAPVSLQHSDWSRITTDASGCLNRNCPRFNDCPYFAMREKIRQVDVIVTNYDHFLLSLLADIDLYPHLDDLIIVFDEAHNFVSKMRSTFRKDVAVEDSYSRLTSTHSFLTPLVADLPEESNAVNLVGVFGESLRTSLVLLEELKDSMSDLSLKPAQEGIESFRFSLGQVDPAIQGVCKHLSHHYFQMSGALDDIINAIREVAESSPKFSPKLVETLDILLRDRLHIEAARELFHDYAQESVESLSARWIEKKQEESESHWHLHSVPIDIEHILSKLVWEQAHAVLCTSATLDAGDDFEHYLKSVGLTAHHPAKLALASPFNLEKAVRLNIPAMKMIPKGKLVESHTREVTQLLPGILQKEKSALVLFTSRKTLDDVYYALPQKIKKFCLQQSASGVPKLLNEHRLRIDAGARSYLLGLDSLREGIDLPGDYCRHVIIAKLPFAVPNDPVTETMEEDLVHNGIDGAKLFTLISIPPVILKMKQACGRLIRNEKDRGMITILDSRIVRKPYGKAILAALPKYGVNQNLS